MSLNIAPVEQVTAEFLCGIIIPEGQGGNAANIVKRAQTAKAIAAALTSIASGNASAGISAVSAALQNASLDPAVTLAIQNMVTLGLQQLAVATSIAGAIPLFGASANAVLSNVAAGVNAAADAEIAKYGSAGGA